MIVSHEINALVPPGVKLVGLHANSPLEDWQTLFTHMANPEFTWDGLRGEGSVPIISLDYETHQVTNAYERQIREDYQDEFLAKMDEFQRGVRKLAPKPLAESEQYPFDYHNMIVSGVSLCSRRDYAFYINLTHAGEEHPAITPIADLENVSEQELANQRSTAGELLSLIFSHCPPGTRFVAHNANYEYRVTMAQGWDFLWHGGTRYNPKIHCTMLMSKLLNRWKHGLKDIVYDLWGWEQPHYADFVYGTHFLPGATRALGVAGVENPKEAAYRLMAEITEKTGEISATAIRRYTKDKNVIHQVQSVARAAAKKFGASHAALRDILYYAGQDSWWGLRLHQKFVHDLRWHGSWGYYVQVEAPILPLVAEMSHTGICVDRDKVLSLRSRCDQELARLRAEIPAQVVAELIERFPKLQGITWKTPADKEAVIGYVEHQSSFMWSGEYECWLQCQIQSVSDSWDSLVEWVHKCDMQHPGTQRQVMWHILRYPALHTTEKGAPSFDREAAARYEPYSGFASLLIDLRRVTQTQSLYAYPYLRLIHPKTGRVHGELRQSGADTGRFTMANPNFQQMAKVEMREIDSRLKLRDCIVAEPGHLLLAPDFSQVELRLTAHYSDDEVMMAAYKGDGEGNFVDIHSLTCDGVFRRFYEQEQDITKREKLRKQYRKIAKTLNFLIVYGGTAPTLLGNLRANKVENFTLEDCARFIDDWNNLYRGVQRNAMAYIHMEASRKGFSETFYGRKRHIPGLRDMTKRAVRQAVNHRIQGTACDVIKVTMARLFWNQELRDLGVRTLLTIHDELVFSVPKENLPAVVPIIEQAFTNYGFRVPLETSMGAGATFGDLAEVEVLPSGKIDSAGLKPWFNRLGVAGDPVPFRKIDFGDMDWVCCEVVS